MQKRSLKIAGHGTSVALEPEFWDELERLSAQSDLSMARLVELIDNERETENLASALRLYVLKALKQEANR